MVGPKVPGRRGDGLKSASINIKQTSEQSLDDGG